MKTRKEHVIRLTSDVSSEKAKAHLQERFSDVFSAPEHICDAESVPTTMRELVIVCCPIEFTAFD